ncbi:Cdc25 phosphatase Ibp1 [Oleoguttula sp. CCFEE 5521]
MSSATYLTASTLPRISAATLEPLIRSRDTSVAVVDVRDDDHVGGHIHSSYHVASGTHDVALPELVWKLEGKETVVFHCMLSQQRGPKAAINYVRERERLIGKGGAGKEQKVMVLEVTLLNGVDDDLRYGEDKELTEAYAKDVWEGFDGTH